MASIDDWGFVTHVAGGNGCAVHPGPDLPAAVIKPVGSDGSEVSFTVTLNRIDDDLPHRPTQPDRQYCAVVAAAAVKRLNAVYGVSQQDRDLAARLASTEKLLLEAERNLIAVTRERDVLKTNAAFLEAAKPVEVTGTPEEVLTKETLRMIDDQVAKGE